MLRHPMAVGGGRDRPLLPSDALGVWAKISNNEQACRITKEIKRYFYNPVIRWLLRTCMIRTIG